MSEGKVEPEVLPSTSQTTDSHTTTVFPLVSMPKIVLTRIDLNNLPLPLRVEASSLKKPVKRLTEKKNKSLVSKPELKKTIGIVKHGTRLRGKPKKDYKFLSEMGKIFPEEPIKNKSPSVKSGGIVKKVPRLTARTGEKEESNTVKGMLKKTMLQKRSKIAIPPAKKPKLIPTKPARADALTPKLNKEKENNDGQKSKKDVLHKTLDILLQSKSMDTDASEDEFLYDELIDELVNSPHKKASAPEKTTNITLKPNAGNKPPTIVKGGIVKKSSLPPDLKSVASPTTLNSSKLTGTSLSFKNKPSAVDNLTNTPATAETPKASLPSKASPFPIAINPSPPKSVTNKRQDKRGPKKLLKSVPAVKEDPPLDLNSSASTTKQIKVSQQPKTVVKSATSIYGPRGRRPKLGPKEVIEAFPILKTAVEDESDEYTEVETLENIDSETAELSTSDLEKNDDVQVIKPAKVNGTIFPDAGRSSGSKYKNDDDPNLDLLRILTDDTEDISQSDTSELKGVNLGSHNSSPDKSSSSKHSFPDPPISTETHSPSTLSNQHTISKGGQERNPHTSSEIKSPAKLPSPHPGNKGSQGEDITSQTAQQSTVEASEETVDNSNESSEPEPVVEEVPRVRTIYDLMSEVSLQYPSWNLHIIPETNAFCIAQVTKGRLGLPTLKKCIELDPDTYSAKVYIHQYHIKRFDGVYDSEEAILALIEEIHSIKA